MILSKASIVKTLFIVAGLTFSSLNLLSRPEFVDSKSCRDCHESEYAQWTDSHHDWAMDHANPATVLGDFNDRTFEHFGEISRFFKKDGKFYVNTTGPDGEARDFEIKYTFGISPLQQYLVEFPNGHVQCLSIAWDTEKKTWFHLYPDERIAPEDPLHWTQPSQRWNFMCAECHSTNLQKNYDRATDRYTTTWHEMDVGCQACHGPGSEHINWAKRKQVGESGLSDELKGILSDMGLLVDYKTDDPTIEMESCARCHSRRHAISPQFKHGERFYDHYRLETLREELYFPDGQIQDEVYVYGSFLQSKMHQAGLRCTDCHNPHTAELRAPGDLLCASCHNPTPPLDRFPSLSAKDYQSAEHHFHPENSTGASCINCHAPARNYMVIDARHDHSFRIPRPDLTQSTGTPNACNQCHTDKTAAWAETAMLEWYGRGWKDREHLGTTLHAARTQQPDAQAKLTELFQSEDAPAIIRATALEHLAQYGRSAYESFKGAYNSPDPIIRTTALSVTNVLPDSLQYAHASAALNDPIRSVRIEAARVLYRFGEDIKEAHQDDFESAFQERMELLDALDDSPATCLNRAVMHQIDGNVEQAIESYKRALELNSQFMAAQVNLANLYNRIGKNEAAEALLKDAIQHSPENGELHYSLGLLLVEMKHIPAAAKHLKQATDLTPRNSRMHYNYSLVLQQLGQDKAAENELLKAGALAPKEGDIIYALAVFYLQRKQPDSALEYALKLDQLYPSSPNIQRMIQDIQRLKTDTVK